MNGVLRRVGARDLAKLRKDQGPLESLLDGDSAEGPGEVLQLEKGWQGLHWQLCGEAWEAPAPMGNATLAGEAVGEGLGYGPARVVNPKKVQDVASALALLSAAQVMTRYKGEAMEAAEIYPGGFAEDDSWRQELEEDFDRLKRFYQAAFKDGDAALCSLE